MIQQLSNLPFKAMELVCASCQRRWTPKKGRRRFNSCPECRHESFSSAMRRSWKRRAVAARVEALPDTPATTPLAPLDQLIRDVDAASAKALKALQSVTLPTKDRQ